MSDQAADEVASEASESGEGRTNPRKLHLGEGAMPPESDAFSWPAFLFPGLWTILYGVWPLLPMWIAMWFIRVSSLAGIGAGLEPVFIVAVLVAGELAFAAYRVWLGQSGARLSWAAANRRETTTRVTVGRILDARRGWRLLAGVSAVAGLLIKVGVFVFSSGGHSLWPALLLTAPVVYLVAFLAALDLDFRGLFWRALSRVGVVPMSTEAGSAASPIEEALTLEDTLDRRLGYGEMPEILDSFNWGAFFFPLIWAIRYAAWRVIFGYLFFLVLSEVSISMLLGWFHARSLEAIATVLVLGVAALWLGANGNRFAWEAARRRVDKGVEGFVKVRGIVDGRSIWRNWGLLVYWLPIAIGLVMLAFTYGRPDPLIGFSVDELVAVAVSAVFLVLAFKLTKRKGRLWNLLVGRIGDP